ncbi:hypothetical protein PSTG_18970, partial [Puccinia striiformis f. sp. tritici PST-78]
AIKQQLLPTLLTAQQQYQRPNYNPARGRPLQPNEIPLFSSALDRYHQEHPTTTRTTTTTTTTTEASTTAANLNKNSFKSEAGNGTKTTNSKKPIKTIARDELLKQLKAAFAEAPQQQLGNNKTYDEMDLVLPNGQRVQVIRTTDKCQ